MYSLKTKLIGAFDLLFLFGRGVNAFSDDRRAALKSLVIPLCFMPTTLILTYFHPPLGLRNIASSDVVAVVFLKIIVTFTLTLLFLYCLAKLIKRPSAFYHYLHAANWVSVLTETLAIFFSILAIAGFIPAVQFDRLIVILSCYFYIVNGCILFRSYRINWQLAGATTIATLWISENLWNLIFAFLNIERPW